MTTTGNLALTINKHDKTLFHLFAMTTTSNLCTHLHSRYEEAFISLFLSSLQIPNYGLCLIGMNEARLNERRARHPSTREGCLPDSRKEEKQPISKAANQCDSKVHDHFYPKNGRAHLDAWRFKEKLHLHKYVLLAVQNGLNAAYHNSS